MKNKLEEKKWIKVVFIFYIGICLFFMWKSAGKEIEQTAVDQYGLENEDTVEITNQTDVKLEFKTTRDKLTGIALKFQSEKEFDDEILEAELFDQNNQLLTQYADTLKYERIQNKDGGSYIFFSLPVDKVKDENVYVKLKLKSEDEESKIYFVTSKKSLSDSILWVDGSKQDTNLVFYTRYSLGYAPNTTNAVLTGLVWLILGSAVFYAIWNSKKSIYSEKTEIDDLLITDREKLIGVKKYVFTIVFVIFIAGLLIYTYQYGVEKAIDDGAWYLKRMYFVLSVMILITAFGLFYNIYMRRISAQKLFIYLAVPLGMIFSLLITINSVPDEPSHVDTAYSISNEIMRIPDASRPGYIYKRIEDVEPYREKQQKMSVGNYKLLFKNIFRETEDTELVETAATSNLSNSGIINYLPQALGVTLGRVLGWNRVMTLLLGRWFALISYVILTYFAIRKMPFAKISLLLIAILPISLQQAASFSYDSVINGIAFLYVAYCVYAIYCEKIEWIDMVVIAVTGGMTAYVKGGVYIAMLLLLPVALLTNNRLERSQKITLGWIGVGATVVFIGKNLLKTIERFMRVPGTAVGGAFSTEIYTFSYIVKYPHRFIGMLANTFYKQGDAYIRNLFGGNLGWREININWAIVIGFIVLILLSCIRQTKEPKIIVQHRMAFAIITIGTFGCIELSMMLAWTPVTINYITGVQGRYFIPFFLLLLLLIRNSFFQTKRNISQELVFGAGILNIITILQVVQKVLEK